VTSAAVLLLTILIGFGWGLWAITQEQARTKGERAKAEANLKLAKANFEFGKKIAISQVAVKEALLRASMAEYKQALALVQVYEGEVGRLNRLKKMKLLTRSDYSNYLLTVKQMDRYKNDAKTKRVLLDAASDELIAAKKVLDDYLRNNIP
jgi:hypothetical protein